MATNNASVLPLAIYTRNNDNAGRMVVLIVIIGRIECRASKMPLSLKKVLLLCGLGLACYAAIEYEVLSSSSLANNTKTIALTRDDDCLSSLLSNATGPDLPRIIAPELGCATLCLLGDLYFDSARSDRVAPHGNMLYCFEVADGVVSQPDPELERDCLWGKEVVNDHGNRRGLLREYLSEVAKKDVSLRGTVVVDLHDHTTSDVEYLRALRQLGIPLLTPNCGWFYDPVHHYHDGFLAPEQVMTRGRCAVSIPIVDAHFISTKGYPEMNRRTDESSRQHPWESKKALVAWRGSSTGWQNEKYQFPDPRFNQRCAIALASKRMERLQAAGNTSVPRLEAWLTSTVQMSPENAKKIEGAGLVQGQVSLEELIEARGVLDVDGNANSWDGAWWKFRSNSVVLKVESPFAQWWYVGLKPWTHYVPVKPDLSDLEAAVAFVLDPRNDERLKAIAAAATKHVEGISFESEVARTAVELKRAFGGKNGGSHSGIGDGRIKDAQRDVSAQLSCLLRRQGAALARSSRFRAASPR